MSIPAVFPLGFPGKELIATVAQAPAWRAAPWRNINDWPRIGSETNDYGRFQRASTEIGANGFLMVAPNVEGDGSWLLPQIPDVPLLTRVDVLGGQTIKGLNAHALINTPGGDNSGVGVDVARSAPFIVQGKQKVVFEDLYFKGDNGTTPATFSVGLPADQFQGSCITVIHSEAGVVPEDVVIRGCTFEYLYGFSVHAFLGRRNHLFENTMRYTANGCNFQVEADSIQMFNSFHKTEGFETTGARTMTIGNVLTESLGGLIVGGTAVNQPGSIIGYNTVDVHPTLGQGLGIGLGDGFVDSLVVGNVIVGAQGYALYSANSFGAAYQPARNLIANNIFRNSLNVAILGASADTLYADNIILGGGNVAFVNIAPRCSFTGNIMSLGTGTPRAFQLEAGSTDTLVDDSNQYPPFAYFDATAGDGTATFRDGSFVRLTARPTVNQLWRGCTVAVRSTTAADDTLDKGMQQGGAGVYAWRSLV